MTHLTKTEERIVAMLLGEPCIPIKQLAHKLESTPGSIRVLMSSLRGKGYKFKHGVALDVPREP